MADELDPKTRALVEEAVEQTLLKLGVNISTPEEILEVQRDFQHLRTWRKASQSLSGHSFLALISIVIGGALAAIWVGLTEMMRR